MTSAVASAEDLEDAKAQLQRADFMQNPQAWFKAWSGGKSELSRETLAMAVSGLLADAARKDPACPARIVDMAWSLNSYGGALSLQQFLDRDNDMGLYNLIIQSVSRRSHARVPLPDGVDSAYGMTLLRSAVSLSHYTFEKKIGEGAQGSVMVCKASDGTPCVVKVNIAGDKSVEELLAQSLLLQSCKHENIISLDQVFIAEPGDCMTGDANGVTRVEKRTLCGQAPLCAGGDLENSVIQGALNSQNVTQLCWRVLSQVASGLHWFHSPQDRRGFRCGPVKLHRDIKPANILLADASGSRFLIADLDSTGELVGRAKLHEHGTYEYQPPEAHGRGGGEVSPPSDIWSLGAVIVFVVLRDSCLEEELINSDVWANQAKLESTIRNTFHQNRVTDSDLITLVARMLDHNVERRPTAKEIKEIAGGKSQ